MLLTFISFFLWIPAILGIGSLGHIPYHAWINKQSDETIVENAILGMALISAIANWINFFSAIFEFVQLAILLLGWSRFFYIWYKKKYKKPSRKLFLGAMLLVVGLSFLRAHVVPSYHDSGLYGLQNVLWYNAMPLPLGLANLHGRFAYNSAWLALVSVIQFPTADFFFSGELLLWFMSFIMLFSIESSIKAEWRPSIIYGLLLSLVFTTPVLGTFILGSIATDYPVFWLSIASGWVSLRLLERKIQPTYALWFTTILFLWGITLKLSAFPLFLIVISQLFIVRENIRHFSKPLIKGISFFAFFLLLPWIVRFFLMSGCFFYPIPFTCVSGLKWGVSSSSVRWMSGHIQQFAINHTLNPVEVPLLWFTDKTLLRNWVNRYFSYSETFFLFFFIILGIVIYFVTRGKGKRKRIIIYEIIIILPYIGGVIFWFFTAPAIRFGSGYIWVVALLLLSFGVYYMLQGTEQKTKKLSLTFIQALLFGLLVTSIARRVGYSLNEPFRLNWVTPAQAPVVETYSWSIDGVDVHYPVKSDLLCWGESLPCAPELYLDLRIEKDSMGHISMFYLEGR